MSGRKPVAEFKFFRIFEMTQDPKRKTKSYSVESASTGIRLAVVEWYGPWRQFCFFPARFAETVWSKGCLEDINTFFDRLKEERAAKR